MNPLFPPEIVKTSVENHFSKFSKKSNFIYVLILVLFVATVISMFFIKIEITVQSRGMLRASSEPISLVSPVVAEVAKIKLSENEFVKKGDTILYLNCKKLDERVLHFESLIQENEGYLSDINKMLEYKYSDLQTNLFESTHAKYRQKLAEYDLNISLQEKNHLRAKQLFEKNVIPLAEMEEKCFVLKNVQEKRKNFISASRNEWESQAVAYRHENKKYEGEIQNLLNEKKNFVITAPASGYITQYSGIKTGSYVTTGEQIAIISIDDRIISEQLVPPKDIGYFIRGMPVIYQVDAYNYTEWGLASGKVTDISNEVYFVNNRPFFKVRSNLDQSYLNLKNGYKGELKKGLTLTARFQVTKRSLAQLVFDKTDDWLNPKIIAE